MTKLQMAYPRNMAIAHHVSNCDLSVLYHFEGINSYPPSCLVDLRNIMDPSDVVSHPNNGASLVFWTFFILFFLMLWIYFFGKHSISAGDQLVLDFRALRA